MNDTELDQRLKEWASRQDARVDTRALGEKIIERLARGGPAAPPRRWTHGLSFAAGAAAVLIASLALFVEWTPRSERQFKRLLREEARLSEQRHASLVKIFNETERVFGANLQWIAEEENSVGLGVSETPSDAEPMVLRITVVRKDTQGRWQRFYGMEAVVRNRETLMLGEPLSGWRYVNVNLDTYHDSQVDVGNSFRFENCQSGCTLRQTMHRFGEVNVVWRYFDENNEYRVLQTVSSVTGEG